MAAEIIQHRTKASTLFWVALAFGIFAVVGLYSARMTNDYPTYDDGRVAQRKATLAKVQHDENALLYPTDKDGKPTAVWVDQDKGLIQIPIDEAMTHEVADLKNVPVGIGAAIPGIAPAPAPVPAPAATNAAPAAATPPASTNAAPAKAKKKKPAKTTPAATGMILTPDVINQPVFNVRNIKAAPGKTFQGFITYGDPINPSTGSIVMQVPTTGTN